MAYYAEFAKSMNVNMLPVGTLLRNGTYRVAKQLSSGGFGNTYIVENVDFDETFAMKEFFMKGINTRTDTYVSVSQEDNKELFGSQKEKFKKEAQRLRKLKHPGIVKIHDLFEENDTYYYVMDFIDGMSLADILKQQGALTEQDALKIMRDVLYVMDAVHSQELTHMDIKPANIMLDKNGQVYLIDFGASKQIYSDERHTLSTSTAVSYTKGYAPIEQVNEELKNIGPWTDLYALGATLYNMLTLKQPPSSSEIINDGDGAFLFPHRISDATKNLIMWMMRPGRQKRPQAVQDVLNVLDTIPFVSESSHLSSESEKETSEETILHKNDHQENTEGETIVSLSAPEKPSKALRISVWFYLLFIAFALIAPIIVLITCSNNEVAFEPTYEEAKEAPYVIVDDGDIAFNVNDLFFHMKYVQGGVFWMGAWNQEDAPGEEYPVHWVKLNDYWIGETEVTQALWEEVMGYNPSENISSAMPVESVSYEECQDFVTKLSNITGEHFRLPTEAEWEYAARGGFGSTNYDYSGSNNAEEVGWIKSNSTSTNIVGIKKPNELGLYDMTGNVCEWCQDWYGEYTDQEQTDPQGPATGTARVGRGGGWCNSEFRNRVSARFSGIPTYKDHNLGLRLVWEKQ